MDPDEPGQDFIFLLTPRSEFVYPQVAFRLRMERSKTMKNPLDSLMGTIISGLVLTLILYFIVGALV
jgi:hypothetical protein